VTHPQRRAAKQTGIDNARDLQQCHGITEESICIQGDAMQPVEKACVDGG
jgi:hypothetical protein